MEAGGVAEIVRDGENGLLVEAGDTVALGDAIRRYFDDPELRGRLRAGAVATVAEYAQERVFGRLEERLAEVAL